MECGYGIYFLFSSRRRHTSWNCDWSSDLCSSDLVTILAVLVASAASALAVALWLGRTIAARISTLERVAAQFAAGDLAARAPVEGGRELAALGASFNQMAESIEQIFDARRQLVACASHDMRTPLAAIQAMLEAIEDGLAAPQDYLPALVEQAAALSALTDDLFELARIDAGTLTVELRDTSLGRVVTSCVRALQAEATARGVHIEADVGDELPP